MTEQDRELFDRIEPRVTSMGLDLVEVTASPGRRGSVVRVVIHSIRGITLDDCARVTRALGPVLDAAEWPGGRYVLEVSSPGLDRVLRHPREFGLFRGATVRMVLAPGSDEREVTGIAVGQDGESVVIRREDGRETAIPWSSVAKARLVPERPGRAAAGGKER